ncbi:MAG: T9SS type A sorting domain-containing protein [Flavipsychrobacter sp.]
MKKFFILFCLYFIAHSMHGLAQSAPPKLNATASSIFNISLHSSGAQIYTDSMQYFYLPTRTYSSTRGWQTDTQTAWYNNSTTYAGYHLLNRTILKYDDSATLTVRWNQNYDNVHFYWVNNDIDSSAFDPGHRLMYNSYKIWDATSGNWQNSTQRTYTYGTGRNPLGFLDEVWDNSLNRWVNSFKAVEFYSATNDLSRDSGLGWNNVTNTWGNTIYSYVRHFIYDAYHHVVNDTVFLWSVSSTTWLPLRTDSFAYNSAGQTIYIRRQQFDTLSMAWGTINTSKTVYDAGGHDLSDTSWVNGLPTSLTTYTYDALGDVLLLTEYNWDNGTSKWQDLSQLENTYDSHGNKLAAIGKVWNAARGFVNSYRSLATFNSYNQQLTRNDYVWDTTGATWLHNFYEQYYYDTALNVASIPSPLQAKLSVYPVPAVNTLNISITESQVPFLQLAIYDISGRLYRLWHADITNSYHTSIPVTDMPAGSYILVARNGNATTATHFNISR